MPEQEYNGFDPANPEDQDDMYREFSSLKNATQNKISVTHGYPNISEMAEGEITLRYVPGQGMFMFVRFRNKLYNTRMAEEGRTGIAKLTDSTTGTVSDTVDDTTATQKDDVATLAAKINEIIGKL